MLDGCRLASKLSLHGRHIRGLTNGWVAKDLQSLVHQYELLIKFKELSDAVRNYESLTNFAFYWRVKCS